ncbi:MAG: hypothetical protein ABFR95_01090 [Actinomycetota bacterium]
MWWGLRFGRAKDEQRIVEILREFASETSDRLLGRHDTIADAFAAQLPGRDRPRPRGELDLVSLRVHG